MAKKNRAALAQLDEALHAVGDCDQAVWTLKKSIGECRSRLGGGSFASTAAEARQIARALAMCAKSIDAAVAAAVAESVAAAEKAPGGATPVAWGAGKGRKEFGGAGSNVGAVGASTPAARTRPASAPLDMDIPAAARLVAAARETVTVHLVRPRKPTTSENNNNNLKPPVAAPPKPVPFQFQRRVRDEVEPATGIGAFAQLLPAMQEKLGMATHVVEVVGADGCVRRSDADFVDGEVCTVYGAADSRRAVRVLDETHDSTAVSNGSGTAVVASREGLVRLATASARMSRVVVNLIPTSSRVKAMAGELEESPTEVTLPASCSTRVECVRVCEGALYKSKRICTPLLGLYAADGSSLGGVEGLLNGDVLLYRTAKEPTPNVGGGGASIPRGTSQRARTASLAAPKAEWSQSFEVSVSRVGCERDAVAMRLPSRGLENMSRNQLSRRIRMACALSPDTDVDAVYVMPHAEKVEHPAQLAGATRVVYTLEGDESPKPEPGALTKKKKISKGPGVRTIKSNIHKGDTPVYNPRPNTAPPSRLRPPTRKTQYGFGGVVPFAGKEYLPSAMASAAKSSSKKAATLQAQQLELGDSYDGLVTSAITPRSSAEKLLVNNPMGLQHRRPRPESARVTSEQTPSGSKEDESVQNSVGHFDLRASFEFGGSISIPASPGQTPVRERWEVNAASMDASTLRAKNAEAASAWAEYHEKNAWPSPELRRIAELGYVPAPVASPADTAREHLRG